MKKMVKAYLKRFAESVIDFAHRLRKDQFLRTEVAVVILQLLLSLMLLGVVWAGFTYLEQELTNSFVSRITESIQTDSAPLSVDNAARILQDLQEVETRSLFTILAAIILSTALFGYALARFALIPARNTLEYQKQFIGNIAHELRTPLSIIKTNTEVALLDGDREPEIQHVLESTVEELNRISNIIDNLLSLSVFTRPERIEFKSVNLEHIVYSSIEKLRPLSEKKKHSLTFKKEGDDAVWGNATAIEQLVTNVIKNALNYTPSGGHVEVRSTQIGPNSVELSIKDSGIGIAEKDLARIFEPFYRAESSRNRATGSSGLGLAIVLELVKLHNAKIAIRSKENQGTEVIVAFPRWKKRTFF